MQVLLQQLAPSIMTQISRASLPLAIPLLKHGNEYLYRSGCWVASKIPKMLGAVVSSNCSQSTCREIICRPVPGTSQQEAIKGTFLPAAGSEEQQICHDCDIPPQPSHTCSCLLAVQTPPEHSLTKPEPIPGLPNPSSIAFPNSYAAFPKGCCTDVCLVSIPEAVNTILEYI